MTDTIIVGLLSLAGTCIGSLSGLRMTSYRIEQPEKFAERIPVLEEKIEVANKRIHDLERHEENEHA